MQMLGPNIWNQTPWICHIIVAGYIICLQALLHGLYKQERIIKGRDSFILNSWDHQMDGNVNFMYKQKVYVLVREFLYGMEC